MTNILHKNSKKICIFYGPVSLDGKSYGMFVEYCNNSGERKKRITTESGYYDILSIGQEQTYTNEIYLLGSLPIV